MSAQAEPIEGEVIEENNVAALATRKPDTQLVELAAPIERIEQAFKSYQELCRRLLEDSDYQTISQWDPATRSKTARRFPKKSAWRKLSNALGVTFEIISKEKERDARGRIISADFVIRATAPNGRFVDGWGNCNVFERCCEPGCRKGGKHKHCSDPPGEHEHPQTHFSHAEHDIPATAETRAKNRAASDLFGMGEVSAEEVIDHEDPPQPPPPVDERLAAARASLKEAWSEGADMQAAIKRHLELHDVGSDAKWQDLDAEVIEAVVAGARFELDAQADGAEPSSEEQEAIDTGGRDHD